MIKPDSQSVEVLATNKIFMKEFEMVVVRKFAMAFTRTVEISTIINRAIDKALVAAIIAIIIIIIIKVIARSMIAMEVLAADSNSRHC